LECGERLPVGAVAAVGELAKRVRERRVVGEIGERGRPGQHRCELTRMIMKPSSPRNCWQLSVVRQPSMPVEEVAEREQVAQIDRWRELLAGERGRALPFEQRVDPALSAQQPRVAGDAHHVGRGEVRSAECLLVAAPAARGIAHWASAIVGPAAARADLRRA